MIMATVIENTECIKDTPYHRPGSSENPYYFESDHAALKCNSDYHNLLKSLCQLEAQRIKAIQDIDQLYKCQEYALKDPILFVERLQHGDDMNFPRRQTVAEIPSINWEAYTSRKDISAYYAPKHMTRKKKTVLETCPSTSTYIDDNDTENIWKNECNKSKIVVRGRLKDENKPMSFNQLWSVEEQKRLEELLVKHPPEEVESRRWQKIAAALGNRTTQQVASRVQKYFIKLAKAGLPVPGRTPNLTSYTRKSGHRHHRFNRFYHQSTFLQGHDPPVYMSDNDDDSSGGGASSLTADIHYIDDCKHLSDDEDIPQDLHETKEYKELIKLRQLKMTRLDMEQYSSNKCDNCQSPVSIGNRWHCMDCEEQAGLSTDLCQNCIDGSFEHPVHNLSHRLEPMNAQSYVDNDYTKFSLGDYNYLDPNYMPAN